MNRCRYRRRGAGSGTPRSPRPARSSAGPGRSTRRPRRRPPCGSSRSRAPRWRRVRPPGLHDVGGPAHDRDPLAPVRRPHAFAWAFAAATASSTSARPPARRRRPRDRGRSATTPAASPRPRAACRPRRSDGGRPGPAPRGRQPGLEHAMQLVGLRRGLAERCRRHVLPPSLDSPMLPLQTAVDAFQDMWSVGTAVCRTILRTRRQEATRWNPEPET